MAVPAEITTLNLSGRYTANKTLSDDTAPILTGQGVSWFLRKAVSMGTVTLSITHSRDDAGVETLHADQVLTGGLGGITETRVLDWEQRDWDNLLLGKCVVKTKRVTVAELEEEYLREGWTAESQKHGVILEFVESGQKNGGKGWSTYMVAGIAEVDGEKRYVRRVVFVGPKGEKINGRLVYDYLGTLA